ncbi:ketoacyl-ACP synthase III [Bacillus sp. E(2018)]|uniref:3-oxoacyl-ACP synthase III family protein n=1 Tax=Bacillus sp. E(2018) TaxID=2502239 RepID=UPI0010FA19D5|nr:ketoacyl-ACP synthase III [Bacillus sp. E(2018)]
MTTQTVVRPSIVETTGLKIPVTIQGAGFAVPSQIVTNDELSEKFNTTDQWIQEKTGIKERRYLEDGRTTSDLCIEASLEAIAKAGIQPSDLDAIIITTTTPDQCLPSTAMIIKDALGATRAMPIDLNQAACAGGIYSILIGSHLLQNEHMNNVLVIGAEILSRIMDPTDRSTSVFFGDAAGAVVLQKTSEGYGLLAWDVDSKLNDAVKIVGGGATPLPEGETLESGQYIKMNGREVWNVATEAIPSSIRNVVKKANLTIEDIDHFLIHQANVNIVRAALDELQVPEDKTTFTVHEYANTGSATLFSVLYKALQEQRINEGDTIVFSAIGAGFLWGSLCLKYINN